MTATPKRPGKRQSRQTLPASPAPIGIVVRRGALKRFDKLIRSAAALPVEVSWDRRTAGPQPAGGPRKLERRQPPPFTWETADFVVVEQAPESATPARTRARDKPAAAKKAKPGGARK